MATPGIPSYAEVQATRRKNASVLASKVLGDPASQPSILNLAEEPAPPKSRRRRFIERLPNTLLVASSAVAVSAALLLCADSIDAALKENQVYVSFILPWMTRSRAAAGWVLLCSIILAIGDALLMWRLARNKDAPPGLLPWVSIALTAAQAVSHHAWQQIPVACALATLVCMLRMWDEIRRQRRFRGAELEMSRTSALGSRERIALLEAQLRQAELVARVERDTVRRSETLLHAAREEADTMQGALMVAAAEMERFAAALRSRYGTAALDSLLASAVISNEAFGRGAGGGSGGSTAGYSASSASGAGRAGYSSASAAAPAATSTRARPIAEDYAGEAEGDGHEHDDDHDDALGDGFLADGTGTTTAAGPSATAAAAAPAASAAALATLEHASDDAVADAHASSTASASTAAASAGGTVRPPAGPRAGVTAAASASSAAGALAASGSGSGAASVSGSSVSSRKTGQTSRSGHTGQTGQTGSHTGSRASGGRSRLPATRIVIGADGSAVLTTSGSASGR